MIKKNDVPSMSSTAAMAAAMAIISPFMLQLQHVKHVFLGFALLCSIVVVIQYAMWFLSHGKNLFYSLQNSSSKTTYFTTRVLTLFLTANLTVL